VQSYFAQQLAAQVTSVRLDVRNGLEQHFRDAEKLEREGLATKAHACKPPWRAIAPSASTAGLSTHDTASAALARLLRSDAPWPRARSCS